ncbi:MAG: hypothetical protein ACO1OF_16285 [Adhaeribacter sp.]
MIIGEIVKKSIENSEYSTEYVAQQIGMSFTNLYRLFKKDSWETKYLIQIAELLKLPLAHFLPQLDKTDKIFQNINQEGFGNAAGSNFKQKIMGSSNQGTANESSDLNIDQIVANLKICETEKAGLLEQLKLKDQLLAAKEELINQLKK